MRLRPAHDLTIFLLLVSASGASAQIRGQVIAGGLSNPVAIAADPTDRSVLFVVEQVGLIRVVRGGAVQAQPFLDLRSDISSGGERGLLGLALAPDFATSGRFFVNFTNRGGDTVVARYRRQAANPAAADPASRFDLVWPGQQRVIAQPFANHNGGHLAFGPDGYLYIGMGDGGSGGDPSNHAQNPQSLLGKMLRVDVAVPDDDARGYRVPPDNPFVDAVPIAALGEIWAFGLRNPWRFSFDEIVRGGSGALLIGDVGQNTREEINYEPARAGGRNYGWRLREGREVFDERIPPPYLPLIKPIHDYPRSIGAAVTGGLVYRGGALTPGMNGRYFFADFITGRVFSLALQVDSAGKAGAHDLREHTAALGGSAVLGMISSFGTDHDGEMLILNHSAGTIVRVTPDPSLVPAAPQLRAGMAEGWTTLEWDDASDGVEATGYMLEVLQNGIVTRRAVTRQNSAIFRLAPGVCVRVRATARSGAAGPPSAAIGQIPTGVCEP